MTVQDFNTLLRDFKAAGIPSSGFHNPKLEDMRDTFNALYAKFIAANAGAIIYETKALLDADLVPADKVMAWVIGDGDNDGVYAKNGATALGSWEKRALLPYSIIQMNNAGAGTANDIVVTTAVAMPSAAYSVVYNLNITADNTDAVTVNGKPLKTNSGAEVPFGTLTAGSSHLLVDAGADYRLLTDGNTYKTVIELINAGAGTANALQVTSPQGIPTDARKSLLLLDIVVPNTTAMTLSINGLPAKPIVTMGNDPVPPGYCTASMSMILMDTGATYKMYTPGDIVAEVLALRNEAENWRNQSQNFSIASELSAGNSSANDPTKRFVSIAGMLIDTGDYTDFSEGDYLDAGGHKFTVAASGASDHDMTMAGGVKVYAKVSAQGTLSVLQFGVKGEGVQSDALALKKAIEFAASVGATLLGRAGDTYLIDQVTICDVTGSKPFCIDMQSATIKYINDGTSFQITGRSDVLSTTLASEPARNDPLIALTDVTGIQKGDMLAVINPAYTSGTVAAYHVYTVDEFNGNDVYIDAVVVADINAQQIIDSGASGSVTVDVYRLAPEIRLKNWKCLIDGEDVEIAQCLVVHGFSNVIAENCSSIGHTRNAYYFQYCSRVRWNGGFVAEMGYLDKNEQYGASSSSAPNSSSSSFGYGIITAHCGFVNIHGVVAGQGWHAVDFARGTMFASVSNSVFGRNAYALSTHESSWHVSFDNCKMLGGEGSTPGRSAYVHYNNCLFETGYGRKAIGSLNGCVDAMVVGCTFKSAKADVAETASFIYSSSVSNEPRAGALSLGHNRRYVCRGNSFLGAKRNELGFYNSTNNAPTYVMVENNLFDDPASAVIFAGSNTIVNNNTVRGDTYGAGLSVDKIRAGVDIYVSNNNIFSVTVAGGSSAISLYGTGPANRISITNNNSTAKAYFLRINTTNGQNVEDVIGNISRPSTKFIRYNTAGIHSITNLVNNIWSSTDVSASDGVAVTNNIGSVDL